MLGKKICTLKQPDLYVIYIISFRDGDDFVNVIVIRHFVFILERAAKILEGNLLATYDNESQ